MSMALTVGVALLLAIMTVIGPRAAMANTPSGPTSNGGVKPYIVDDPGPGGNVTCEQLGYEHSASSGTGGNNYNSGSNSFENPWPAGISVTVTGGTYVAWTSTFPIGAVIVKGGNAANIYEYIPPSLGDSGLASPTNSSGDPAGLSNLNFCWNKALEVAKTAKTSYDKRWTWEIHKVGDEDSLVLSTGQSYFVNYEVTVKAASAENNFKVKGEITIKNPNSSTAATITGVSDVVSGGIAATVDCGVSLPYSLAAGATLTCSYETALPNKDARTNTATVTTSGKVPGGSGEAAVTFGAPTNELDECITVTDDKLDALGTVCAGEAPKTFTYSLEVGPYDTCGEYSFDNTATFTTNDTKTTGSDSHSVKVTVPCASGCTLTQGYWKTHSKYGPAPYDDTWNNVASFNEDTKFFLSGKSYYEVLWTPPAGNAYYNLAHQYIAAKLNLANGASSTPAVDAALGGATAFFTSTSPSTKLTPAQRNQLLQWAGTLDAYNNGVTGPGHCSE
jgi:hypothetical protein